MEKSISFVLPGIPWKVSGGAKIVFVYCNKLVEKGYNVTVYFQCANTFSKRRIPMALRKVIIHFIVALFPTNKELNIKVKRRAIFKIDDKSIKDSDYIVATAWHTANPIFNLSPSKGKKIYFIQDHEKWDAPEETIFHTYGLMKNVVIASWLKELVDRHSDRPSVLVPNAINSNIFYINKPINERDKYTIAALYHEKEHKGFKYLWMAIEELRRIYPQLSVRIFGMPQRPAFFPDWVDYTMNANIDNLLEIYNSVSIFMCASINEGFGLTGAEAMACGCALVSTDYQGVHEYATDGVDSLLSPIKDVDAMVLNVKKLIEDNDYRIKIASNGAEKIKRYSIEEAASLFEQSITD